MRATRILLTIITPAALLSCSSAPTPAPPEAPQLTTGNGDANWIVTEGATRDGATFSFREVQIDGNG